MNRRAWEVAWYRFRRTLARRKGGYLSVILLIGLTGGLALGSISAARETQSSYPTFLASTNPSTLSWSVYAYNTGAAGPTFTGAIRRLSDVTHVRTLDTGPAVPLTPSGAPRLSTVNTIVIGGSTDGYLSQQDRLGPLRGRLADSASLNQIVITPAAARVWGVHLGSIVPIGFYSPNQEGIPGFGTPKVKPRLTVDAHVTGIVALNSEIVQDDIDRAYGFAYITPALAKKVAAIAPAWTHPSEYAIQLRHGEVGIANVERELVALVPPGYTYEFHVTSGVTSTVELALKPASVALGTFGAIAALICLLLSIQALARQIRRGTDERRILRAFGASRGELLIENLMGVFVSVVLGTLLAVLVAFALSPLAPLGPVRVVYPDRGLSFDGTVLGGGAIVLLVVLLLFSVSAAITTAPHRQKPSRTRVTRSATVRQVQAAGLPLAAGLGAHFALESRRGTDDVPVRSILMGSILAVSLMVTTLTFASGLNTLVSRPALYGWNWNYALNPSNDLPPGAVHLLNKDPDVMAWSGVVDTDVDIDGQSVPVLVAKPNAAVMPPILKGHGLRANSQIVLGNQTLALLHKRIGQQVVVSYGSPSSGPLHIGATTLTIVGTATFPAVGYATAIADHTSMGTGALVPSGVEPKSFLAALKNKDPNLNGPALVFVRLRPGLNATTGKENLQRIANSANAIFAKDPNGVGNYVTVLDVQRPAQIVDYRSIGATPVILATGLALGAVGALVLTLIASVRRRRHDLAILKTLGTTRRTLSAAIAYQATVDALVGDIVGIPLGILLGRELWTLFARDIDAVAYPTVPTLAVVAVGVATVVIAVLAAAWPGRTAARTSSGLVLRSE